MPKYPLTVLACAVAALALAACGGGSEGSGGDEELIVNTIESSANSNDPASCKKYATLAFLEQTEIAQGEAALESCEASAEDEVGDPDSVSVSEVEIDGDAATADAAFTGGTFDGQTLTLSLVREDGDWKLDRVEGFVDFDRDAYIAAFEANVGEAGLTPAQESCLLEGLEGAEDGQLEALVTSGTEKPLEELFGDC